MEDQKYISRVEHQEFVERMKSETQRLEEEDHRQNKRLDVLETKTEDINKLMLSMQDLSFSIKTVTKENERLCQTIEVNIKDINDRLSKFENADGDKWRKMTGYIATTIVGIILGFLFKYIGM